jgi:thiol-disulfide isomerase/thioredoxin
MSDIPSKLSTWEPPRSLKAGFLASAILSVAALFGAKIYTNYVINPRKVEQAVQAERLKGPAPSFSLKDRAGNTVTLESLRGKLIFVNFWATWCPPCREEMPSLVDLARQLDPNEVVFLAISVDDGWGEVNRFFDESQLGRMPFVTLLDEEKKVAEQFGAEKYPESFVIDRNGQLLYKFTGPRDWNAIAALKILENAGAKRLPPPTKST